MNFALIEAGGTKFVCGVMDPKGFLIASIRIPTTTPEETMSKVMDFFSKFKLKAIGVGCFGPIETRKEHLNFGQIGNTPKTSWQCYNIVHALMKAFNIPVFLDTDVNVAALAEYHWGSAKNANSCLYLTVGTGIGAGFVNGGEVLSGEMHPEMGHIYVKRNPKDDYRGCCPYHGDCLEGLASGTSIRERYGVIGTELGDRDEVWELEADYIAQALANYMMILSPQMIILGGGVMEQERLFDLIKDKLTTRINGYLGKYQVTLTRPALENHQGLFGAASLIFSGLSLPMPQIQPTTKPQPRALEPLFLQPVFHHRIWGGNRLSTLFGYDTPAKTTAECWAVAAHPNGKSVVLNGEFSGWPLDALWDSVPELFGYNGQGKFPLLTKLLDAREDLSVQVHPDNHYAMINEYGESGKTECWYVVDCKPGAELVMGHNATTKEDLEKAFNHNSDQGDSLQKLLNRVAIHPGDFFYVPSGTVHAIGSGTLILETQQNSDTTYRVFDYNRTDDCGQLRALQLDKALDVIQVPQQMDTIVPTLTTEPGLDRWFYLDAPFFKIEKWRSYCWTSKPYSQRRQFTVCSVLAGSGELIIGEYKYPFKKADHFIVPHNIQAWEMVGTFEMVASMV